MAVAPQRRSINARRRFEVLLGPAVQLAGLAAVVVGVYLVVVIGIGRVRPPTSERCSDSPWRQPWLRRCSISRSGGG